MGIGIVLLFWVVIATALAGFGAVLLGGIAFLLTPGVKKGRWAAVGGAVLFPFICIAWAGAVFVLQALVNTEILDRDPGLGDAWYCPLPNGYAVMMVDQLDSGWIYNPKTQTPDAVAEQDDAVGKVTDLQLADRYVLGRTQEGGAVESHPSRTAYFLLNTKAGRYRIFATEKALAAATQPMGIRTNLEPISAIYHRYRLTWFDWIALALLLIPPGIAGLLGLACIFRLRRREIRT